ncbi:MAG: ABC transporter ATP-binding protein [Rhizobiaceae bacterium]
MTSARSRQIKDILKENPTPDSADNVLEVEGLQTLFHTQDGKVHAVNDVSFSLKAGELLGIVGESGSGKSVTMMSLLKLLPMPPAEIVGGKVNFGGVDLLQLDMEKLRDVRGADIGFIFQDPMTSLNPVFTVGFQIMEPLRSHLKLNKKQARERAVELLELVGIPSAAERLRDFPHQFSGGMRQRVMIAIALACDPKVLIADEPTTALDVTVQAQIIEIVKDLRQKLGMAIIWITHDLGVVAGIADRVAVMYGGQIVEYADVDKLYDDPRHPYTRALLQTLPRQEGEREARLVSIPGQAPNLKGPLTACPFAPRCSELVDKCWRANPPLFQINEGQKSACWLEDPDG